MRRDQTSPTARTTATGTTPAADPWPPFGLRLPWRVAHAAIGGALLLACLAIWLNASTRPHALDLPGGLRIAERDSAPGTTILTYVPARIDETGLDGFAAALCGADRYEIHSLGPTWTDRLQQRARVRLTCN